jgi:hypothetical protein
MEGDDQRRQTSLEDLPTTINNASHKDTTMHTIKHTSHAQIRLVGAGDRQREMEGDGECRLQMLGSFEGDAGLLSRDQDGVLHARGDGGLLASVLCQWNSGTGACSACYARLQRLCLGEANERD